MSTTPGNPSVAGPEPILEVRDLRKYFPIKKGLLSRTVGHVRALDGVSFDVHAGEVLGLVAAGMSNADIAD